MSNCSIVLDPVEIVVFTTSAISKQARETIAADVNVSLYHAVTFHWINISTLSKTAALDTLAAAKNPIMIHCPNAQYDNETVAGVITQLLYYVTARSPYFIIPQRVTAHSASSTDTQVSYVKISGDLIARICEYVVHLQYQSN